MENPETAVPPERSYEHAALSQAMILDTLSDLARCFNPRFAANGIRNAGVRHSEGRTEIWMVLATENEGIWKTASFTLDMESGTAKLHEASDVDSEELGWANSRLGGHIPENLVKLSDDQQATLRTITGKA